MSETLTLARPKVRRTLAAAFLNTVANHPEVRPWVGGVGPIDLTETLADSANFALQTDDGGWVFIRHEAAVYELHTLFLRRGRGRRCIEGWREASRYMFCATDCREIVTKVPANNLGAVFAAQKCGFAERFTREGGFVDPQGQIHDVSYQAFNLDAWLARATELDNGGHWFHAVMEKALREAFSSLPAHPADPSHERAVGAAVEMIRARNHRKAVWFYNRWARLAGYPLVTLVTETPLVIDVGASVVVEATGQDMEVILCR
jgi:hypothetical protein